MQGISARVIKNHRDTYLKMIQNKQNCQLALLDAELAHLDANTIVIKFDELKGELESAQAEADEIVTEYDDLLEKFGELDTQVVVMLRSNANYCARQLATSIIAVMGGGEVNIGTIRLSKDENGDVKIRRKPGRGKVETIMIPSMGAPTYNGQLYYQRDKSLEMDMYRMFVTILEWNVGMGGADQMVGGDNGAFFSLSLKSDHRSNQVVRANWDDGNGGVGTYEFSEKGRKRNIHFFSALPGISLIT